MQQNISPRAIQARENNALDVLKNLASQVSPTMPVDQLPQQTEQKEQKNQMFEIPQADYGQPQMDDDAIAFDQEGNFKRPPYEGYWADRLAEVDPENPLLEHGRKIREFLSEIDKVVYGR